MENVLRTLAVKLQSQLIVDTVIEVTREGRGTGASSSVLAKYYGVEGIRTIEKHLLDESKHLRRLAISAVGLCMEKSEVTTASLRRAQQSPDSEIRSLASLTLARHREPFYYEGLAEDIRELVFSDEVSNNHFEMFFDKAFGKPKEFFDLLPGEEAERAFWVVLDDVRKNHPNKEIQEDAKQVFEALTEEKNQ